MDFLKTLQTKPYIILTTAYKEYAIESYELDVADYLLKPFSFDRFVKAVNKVMEKAEKSEKPAEQNQNNDETEKPKWHDNYLVIRADRKYYKINYEDLKYIEGQKAYVTFHTTEKRVTALASLKELEEKLPSDLFIRIHKSYIVSIKKIDALEGNMIEIEGKYFPVGKNYRAKVDEIFGL